ncbi:MAG: hypothetical protein ACLFNQ_04220 [Spirochaetaceae bacterium]
MEILRPYLITIGLTFALMAGWVAVQHLSRWFSARHPEHGTQPECMGCGLACTCAPSDTEISTTQQGN